MHNLPPGRLQALLRAYAKGYYATEAAVELLIAHGTWLARPDFVDACVWVEHDPAIAAHTVGGDGWFAGIDWHTIPAFMENSGFSGSEGRILRLAGELAGIDSGLPLVELLASLDDHNSALVLDAIAHALHHTRGSR